jgi:hypothetical protein
MFRRNLKVFPVIGLLLLTISCNRAVFDKETVAPTSLKGIPALKMNFRFETDVPAPPETNTQNTAEEKNAAVQADFDQNRSQEALEKTLTSPDKQRILAIYRKLGDTSAEYRLDMYSPDGKLLRKITPNGMAVHFPDTIIWSPDGTSVAFVAMTRNATGAVTPEGAPTPPSVETNTNTNVNINTAANTDANANLDTNVNTAPQTTPTVADAPSNVLTLRTEQIYICNADGGDLKLLTQNEGLIYFYFIWSPDSSALVALAATWKEWQYGQYQADLRGEIYMPSGRPRLIEKTGRIRLLDDNTTTVQPVWSPDSAKIALAYDKEVRIYDAIGDAPTQAAIPLRNPLLMSSKTYDDKLQKEEQETSANSDANTNVNSNTSANANTNSNANASPTPNVPQDVNTLPDENSLVSFNPIVQLEWTEDKMLYLQTGYIKELKDAAQSSRSYLRWHRLVLSPQAVKVN